jgi:methylated-DNA-[protein]-cysteine S-methyltransferase
MRYTVVGSPIGELIVWGTDAVKGAEFVDSPRANGIDPEWRRDDVAFGEAVRQLKAYFGGELKTFEVEMDTGGTPFQRRVWTRLQDIPYGATTTYGRLAAELGDPKAMRAVGLANGRNPISIIIPCHRVIGADGNLTGYGGGLLRKQWLLAHERGDGTSTRWEYGRRDAQAHRTMKILS